jgi:hypothetical protein
MEEVRGKLPLWKTISRRRWPEGEGLKVKAGCAPDLVHNRRRLFGRGAVFAGRQEAAEVSRYRM